MSFRFVETQDYCLMTVVNFSCALAAADYFDCARRSVNPHPIPGPEHVLKIAFQAIHDWNLHLKERLRQQRAHYDHGFALHVHDGRWSAFIPHSLKKDAWCACGSPTVGEEKSFALQRSSAQIMAFVDYYTRERIDPLPKSKGLV